ncbi:MAG: FmdB family zinc ribbon protein [Kineosporiaceae bacterium]
MPTYSYACTSCDHRFDVQQSFSDAALTDCPECAGRLRKVFSAVGVVFKGSGFYRTDSRNGGSATKAGGSGDGAASSADGGSAGTGSSDGGATSGAKPSAAPAGSSSGSGTPSTSGSSAAAPAPAA